MGHLKLRPLLILTAKHTSDAFLNRVGVENTADLLKKAFFSTDGLGIPHGDGEIIQDEEYVPVCSKIDQFVASIDSENEIALIYYCGHGFPLYDRETVHLCMTDTTRYNWEDCGYDARRLISLIKEASIRYYVVILDCCHSGFLCGMGDTLSDRIVNIGEYENADGAVYIASAQAKDACYQTMIDGKIYVPFSYYFAKALLGELDGTQQPLSIKQTFDIVKKHLYANEDYNTRCEIQQKNNLGNSLLLCRSRQDVRQTTPKQFSFTNYFDMPVLKVLLVKTAINYPIKQDDFGIPLGLWMLKGYLSTTGLSIEVEIYDERLELRRLSDLSNKKNSTVSKRNKVKDQFSEKIKDFDVIGISLSTSEVPPALEKFKIAKEQGKVTFCGGIFTTSNEEYLISTGVIDYVIPGVGTVPLGNLLAKLVQDKANGTLGEHLVTEYGVVSKESLATYDRPWAPAQLPSMRKSVWLEILQQYSPFLGKRIDVYTARGCDKNCIFCSVQMESRQVVYRKAERSVIEEIEFLKSQGITYFSFKDEDLLSKPQRMLRILGAVKGPGIKFKIRARYDEMVTSGISLSQLHDLGVDEIQYGIESPDIQIRKAVDKGFLRSTNKDLINFIKDHAKYHITANCSFILGIRGEESNYYDDLLAFIKSIYCDDSKPKIYINFLTPHPHNSQFPLNNYYALVTKDLNFFTHKYPVCLDPNATYGDRTKMLRIYDAIVKYTESEQYNPLVSNIPKRLRDSILNFDADKPQLSTALSALEIQK